VAHAHLGAYGFYSFVMFGSIYFILPRVTGFEWPFPRAIAAHWALNIAARWWRCTTSARSCTPSARRMS